jgi:hypothetical protein
MLRLKGFKHLDPYQWYFNDYHKWIFVNVLEEDAVEVNFCDDENYVVTPEILCKGLKYFNTL